MVENPYKEECVYYNVCIDKACPCVLVDHKERDPLLYEDFLDELDEEMKTDREKYYRKETQL